MSLENISTHLLYLKDILLGMSGGMIAYLFDYSKARREGNKDFTFLFSSMFINMALGAFVSYIIGSVLPSDIGYRDALIGFSGVTAYNILLVAESKFATFIINKITNTKD